MKLVRCTDLTFTIFSYILVKNRNSLEKVSRIPFDFIAFTALILICRNFLSHSSPI